MNLFRIVLYFLTAMAALGLVVGWYESHHLDDFQAKVSEPVDPFENESKSSLISRTKATLEMVEAKATTPSLTEKSYREWDALSKELLKIDPKGISVVPEAILLRKVRSSSDSIVFNIGMFLDLEKNV